MNKIFKIIIIIFSLKNLLKVKFLGINCANYFIINDNHNLIDKRSSFFFKIEDCKKTFNLIRLSQVNYQVFRNILKIPNFFCYSIIKELIINNFNKKKFVNLILNLFFFLKIKKFILIDDKREMLLFSEISKKLNIETMIYMHGRLSKNTFILKKSFFKKYLVWSDFFLNQLKKANNRYNKNNVEIVGNPYLIHHKNFKNSKNKIKIKRALILDEDFINYRDIEIYLKKIVEIKNIKLFIKKKITRKLPKEYYDFCIRNNIKMIEGGENLGRTIKKYKFDCIIASTSTGLLEGMFYHIIPIKINSNNKEREKEFKEFVNQKFVFYANNQKSFSFFLKKEYSTKQIIKNKKKLWGNKMFVKKEVNNLVKNFLN
tara:strand:- start:6506 stop:7621 length:1116 start_codon:yes stop_codon:yes gene_type:complete